MAEYDLTAQLTEILEDYNDYVQEEVDKAADFCAKGLRRDLRISSPKLTGSYAKTWTIKTENNFTRGGKRYVVYNKKNYQLTHLLEKPHAGPYGRGTVGGNPHIAPAEKRWCREFEKRCEEVCKV